MPFQIINTSTAPATKGSNVMVSMAGNQASVYATQLFVGQLATVSSSGKTGYVARVDLYGSSFLVKPKSPVDYFDSNQPGYLLVNEIVTLA